MGIKALNDLLPASEHDSWKEKDEESHPDLDTPQVGMCGSVKVFILPNDHMSFSEASRAIFQVIAPTNSLFFRDGAIFELDSNVNGTFSLRLVTPDAFRSRLEKYDHRLMAFVRDKSGKLVLSPKNCSADSAKAIMLDTAAYTLPHIKAITSAPVLVLEGNEIFTVGKGYHSQGGGILVTNGEPPVVMTWEEGVATVLQLIDEFDFQTEGDLSRAVASIITPAMKIGGFLNGFVPVDMAEADQSQSGKTFRHKIVRGVYRETGYPVAMKLGGVGSLDESLSAAILSGRLFVSIDNIRGKMDSQFLEMTLTYGEPIPCRVPYKGQILVDASMVCFQLTSNGIDTTRDLANRSSICRIRKRIGYVYKTYPEGDLLDHVKANQPRFLGAVHSLIREWHKRGMPKTCETRHDFREWSRKLDWIVQNLFNLAPLLDGHEATQERISNPALNWLRNVCLEAEKCGELNQPMRASEIFEICEQGDIAIPNFNNETDAKKGCQVVGITMKRCFGNRDKIDLDHFQVTRSTTEEWDQDQRKYRTVHRYVVTEAVTNEHT